MKGTEHHHMKGNINTKTNYHQIQYKNAAGAEQVTTKSVNYRWRYGKRKGIPSKNLKSTVSKALLKSTQTKTVSITIQLPYWLH